MYSITLGRVLEINQKIGVVFDVKESHVKGEIFEVSYMMKMTAQVENLKVG